MRLMREVALMSASLTCSVRAFAADSYCFCLISVSASAMNPKNLFPRCLDFELRGGNDAEKGAVPSRFYQQVNF
jgi:hypothetical protein